MMMEGRSFRSLSLLSLVLVFIVPSLCFGADIDGSGDPPLLRRYEGSFIVQYSMKEYDSSVIPLGKTVFEGDRYKFSASDTVEGRVTRILYIVPEGRSSLEVFRNYEGELKEKGYEILFSASKEDLGPYDSFAETLYGRDRHYPLPGDERTKNQQFLSAMLARPEGNVFVTLYALEEIAKLLEASPDLKVLVVGHTDSTGDREYNMGLSKRRAGSVVKYLQEKHQIPAARMIPAGVGMLAPVASNRTEEGRAKNRRVELVEF